MGRVGGLAVALGASAVLLMGQTTAWAEPSGSSSSSDSSSTSSSTKSAPTAKPSPRHGTSGSTKATTSTDASTKASLPELPKPKSSDSEPILTATSATQPSRKSHLNETVRTSTARPTNLAPLSKVDVPQLVTQPMPKLGVATPKTIDPPVARLSPGVQPAATTLVQQQAAAPIAAINPVSVITGMVSTLVQKLLNPLGANGIPESPAGTPLLCSLLAFARREFESIFAPSTPFDAAAAQTTSQPLVGGQRTLVLTALPVEADALLARTTLDANPTVVVDGHHFYLGTLGGKPVIIGMTGIGEVNAAQTTEIALDDIPPATGITIGAVVFDGVAGGSGRTEIGDVAVPARWTLDGGATWDPVDAGMLAAASAVNVDLDSSDTIVDPACHLCGPLAFLPLVNLGREPQLFVGGDGSSSDNNNGVAFPEIPLGGSLFGPQPLAAPDFSPFFTGNFFQAIVPFLLQGVISNIIGFLTMTNPAVDAVDQETAAAQQVADSHGVPFLGIRGMSDGPGDPYPLPGYPFTFLVFNQIAADNAAITTEAFLRNWAGA